MNPKGEKIGNMWFGGHKGISSGTPYSGLKTWHLAWSVESHFLGDQISVAALGFVPDTHLNPIGWTQSQQS